MLVVCVCVYVELQMQGQPGGAPPRYPQPGYPQYPGQPTSGPSQTAVQYPAGVQSATGYGQPGQPGVVHGPASSVQPAVQPSTSRAVGALQQQPYPPARPEDVTFQLPPDGKQAVLFNTV